MSKPKVLEQINNSNKLFVAIKGITTAQEILDASNAGKDVIMFDDDNTYVLEWVNAIGASFICRDFKNQEKATTSTKSILVSSLGWSDSATTNTYSEAAEALTYTGSIAISSSLPYYRPILLSITEPTSNDGNVGDIWIQYEE